MSNNVVIKWVKNSPSILATTYDTHYDKNLIPWENKKVIFIYNNNNTIIIPFQETL